MILSITYKLLLLIILIEIINCENKLRCKKWKSTVLKNPVISENGSIIFDLSNGVSYPSNQTFSDGDEMRYCICTENYCVRKCCQDGYSMNKENICINSETQFNLIDIQNHTLNESVLDLNKFRIIEYPIEFDCVTGIYHIEPEQYYVDMNGNLIVYQTNTFNTDYGCLEWHETAKKVVLILCTDFIYYSKDVYPDLIGAIISLPFLLITFVLYCITPDLNSNILGKNVLSQVASFILMYVMFLTQSILFYYDKKEISIYVGYPRVYGMLANFFWLNVTCFDIWLVFSGYSQPYLSLNKDQQRKKFLKYSAYAWTLPGILCIIRYTIAKVKYLIIYNTVTIILFLSNLVLFIATAIELYVHNKITKRVLKPETDECARNYNKTEKERFNLYLKLLLVMGIPWASQPLKLILPSLDLLWQAIFFFNLLQGVLIFIIFICKKRILHAINTKLWPSKIIFTYNESSSKNSKTNKTSSSGVMQSQYANKTDEKEQNYEMIELNIKLKSK